MPEQQPTNPVKHENMGRAVAGAIRFARERDIRRPTLDEVDFSFYDALAPEVDSFVARAAFRDPFIAKSNQVVVGSFDDLGLAMYALGAKLDDHMSPKQIGAGIQYVKERGRAMKMLGVTGMRTGITISEVSKTGFYCETFMEGSGIRTPINKLSAGVLEVYPSMARELGIARIKHMKYKGMSQIARLAEEFNNTANGNTANGPRMLEPLAYATRRAVFHR